jgi:hypothetical protein
MTIALEAILGLGGKLIDSLFPNKAEQDAAKLKLLELQQNGALAELTADTDLMKGQMAVNQEEAKSDNLFVSGWRPAVGWVCVAAFAAKYIGGPALFVFSQYFGITLVLPPIDMTEMLPILVGMLGLGTLRSMDKWKSK